MKIGVIVSGLPASGKTTVARVLAQGLEFAFLDKDDFLEALFDRSAVRSGDERNQLSRQSDGAFHKAAFEAPSAVLVSHWRPLGAASESGTPQIGWQRHLTRSLRSIATVRPSWPMPVLSTVSGIPVIWTGLRIHKCCRTALKHGLRVSRWGLGAW